jgi:hypothetical protein
MCNHIYYVIALSLTENYVIKKRINTIVQSPTRNRLIKNMMCRLLYEGASVSDVPSNWTYNVITRHGHGTELITYHSTSRLEEGGVSGEG